ncbi:LysR family transcriptional regulator [Patulibacter sp. NPDC049589]|uniref:helix-turn-helix domain-containing protein n=1 Tax=Patulibacter sp. NPDC049589 TaxID=3154731 RepID=UPI0034442051
MSARGSARLAGQPGVRRSQPYPLTLIDLEAMVVAARTRDVSETAKHLGISSSAVLRRLRKLEQRVAVALFDGLPANVELTPAGEELLPLFVAAHDRLAALEELVQRHATDELAADARYRSL